MKNMKKLLSAMVALGLTTVAAVNVVACNNSGGEQTNDLTKSFKPEYFITTSDAGVQAGLGLTLVSGKTDTYTYKFANVANDSMVSLITSSVDSPLVNQGVTKTDPTTLTSVNEGNEIAQVVAKSADADLQTAGDRGTVQYVVSLKLFKAEKQQDNSFKYVDQKTSMDVVVTINTIIVDNDLVKLTGEVNVATLNIDAKDLTKVTKDELLASATIKAAIQEEVVNTFKKAETSDYTYNFAADNKGAAYQAVNLTAAATTYVQITATNNTSNLAANSATGWILVNLPIANSLTQITDKSFGTLAAADFKGAKANAVTRADIVTALTANGALKTSLQALNGNFSDFSDASQIALTIATTEAGNDMTPTDTIDLSNSTQNIYITIKPGTTALFSGVAQAAAGKGILVVLPTLSA